MKYTKKAIVPVITGPTASGKTALSLPLAEALGAHIISCDSMQVYRGLDIGTAKADAEEQKRIPHHLLDIRDPGENFSVQDFIDECEKVLEELDARGIFPVFVGGTPQYITSLVEGIRFAPQSVDPELRLELNKRIEAEGGEAMLAKLAQKDPERAAKLHPNDKKRIVRALEIALTSDTTQSEWDSPQNRRALTRRFEVVAVDWPREILYERINERVERMFEKGLADEALWLMRQELPPGSTCLQAIAYKELFPYLRGEMSLEEAKALLKRNSRRYAKRQLTWFRGKDWIRWIKPEETEAFAEAFIERIKASAG